MAGHIGPRRIRPSRGVAPQLRRARLLAARSYPVGSMCRYGIMSGSWDAGQIVGKFMGGKNGNQG